MIRTGTVVSVTPLIVEVDGIGRVGPVPRFADLGLLVVGSRVGLDTKSASDPLDLVITGRF